MPYVVVHRDRDPEQESGEWTTRDAEVRYWHLVAAVYEVKGGLSPVLAVLSLSGEILEWLVQQPSPQDRLAVAAVQDGLASAVAVAPTQLREG